MALSRIWNALFMVGIRGTNVLTILMATVTSLVEQIATILVMQDVVEAETFLQLAVTMAAMAMAMVTALASILSK